MSTRAALAVLLIAALGFQQRAIPRVAAEPAPRMPSTARLADSPLGPQPSSRDADRLAALLDALRRDTEVPAKLKELILESPTKSPEDKLVLMSKACELASDRKLRDSATNRLLAALLDALFGDLVADGRGSFVSSFPIKGLGMVGYRPLEDDGTAAAVMEQSREGGVRIKLAVTNLILSVMKRGDRYFAAYAAGPGAAVVERELAPVDFDPTGVANRAAFVAGIGNGAARVLELQVHGESDRRIRTAIVTMAIEAGIVPPHWYLAWAENRRGREVAFFPTPWLAGWMPRDSADLHVLVTPDESQILGAYDHQFSRATRKPEETPNREVPNVGEKTESREVFELAGKDGRRYAIGIDEKGRFAFKGYAAGAQFVMTAAINHTVGLKWRLLSVESSAYGWENRNWVRGISGLAHLDVGLPNHVRFDPTSKALASMRNVRLSSDTLKVDSIASLRTSLRLTLTTNLGISSLDVTTKNGRIAANAIGRFYSLLPDFNVSFLDTAGDFNGATVLYGPEPWYAKTADLSKPGTILLGLGSNAGRAMLLTAP